MFCLDEISLHAPVSFDNSLPAHYTWMCIIIEIITCNCGVHWYDFDKVLWYSLVDRSGWAAEKLMSESEVAISCWLLSATLCWLLLCNCCTLQANQARHVSRAARLCVWVIIISPVLCQVTEARQHSSLTDLSPSLSMSHSLCLSFCICLFCFLFCTGTEIKAETFCLLK